MKIAFLSCFYPYRGGISQFSASLYQELAKTNEVQAFNFKRQYPDALFPGKTQYVTPDDEALPIESRRILDSIEPWTYSSTAKAIAEWKPELTLISYWMSFFAPSLGYIAGRLSGKSKVISILHNVIPHEPKPYDKPFARYFLKRCTGHVTLCDEVTADLHSIVPEAKCLTLFHPVYSHFGERIDREEAENALGLEHGKKNLLFFGLIREYKGLDILLRAFGRLDDSYQLIVAGEPYGSFAKYQEIISASPAKDRIHLFTHYIKDSEVKKYFSAADLTVLPYRSATQSGINAIACHFGTPMVVTDVGGLREAVEGAGIGLVADRPDEDCLVREIGRFFSDESLRESCAAAMKAEKERLSWTSFSSRLIDFAEKLG
jgi:glycosyltransferase involved in cell wall biosynthesis